MYKLFEARFFSYDKERNRIFLGSCEVDDSNTSYAFPLAAKAFRHAPEKARHAAYVSFERIPLRLNEEPKRSNTSR